MGRLIDNENIIKYDILITIIKSEYMRSKNQLVNRFIVEL